MMYYFHAFQHHRKVLDIFKISTFQQIYSWNYHQTSTLTLCWCRSPW